MAGRDRPCPAARDDLRIPSLHICYTNAIIAEIENRSGNAHVIVFVHPPADENSAKLVGTHIHAGKAVSVTVT